MRLRDLRLQKPQGQFCSIATAHDGVTEELYALQRIDDAAEIAAATLLERQQGGLSKLREALAALYGAEKAFNSAIESGLPTTEPLKFLGNTFNDKYFALYPKKQLPRCPISPHLVSVMSAEVERRRRIVSCNEALSELAAAGIEGGALASHFSEELKSIGTARRSRNSHRCRQRTWWAKSVEAQLQGMDDFAHLVQSGTVGNGPLDDLNACGVTMVLRPAQGEVPAYFISEDLVSVGQLQNLVTLFRKRNQTHFDADVIPFHWQLIARGVLPPIAPLTDAEAFLAMRAEERHRGVTQQWDPTATLLLPRWVAEDIAAMLNCQIPTTELLRGAFVGVEGHTLSCGAVGAAVEEPLAFMPLDPAFDSIEATDSHLEELAAQAALHGTLRQSDSAQVLRLDGLNDDLNPDSHSPTACGLRIRPGTAEWCEGDYPTSMKGFRLVWSHRFPSRVWSRTTKARFNENTDLCWTDGLMLDC